MSNDLVAVLRALPLEDWQRPATGRWRVRDVVAHLIDLTLRRLSFHRDGMVPPDPPQRIETARDFVDFINRLNAEWVTAAGRLSPRVLTDLFENASRGLADWFEHLPLDAPALFGVSWAGEQVSAGWFDVGREFTELWHHQEQIRMAVGAPSLAESRYLRAVLEIAVRGLPHAFRDVQGSDGQSLVLDVSGAAGGTWTLLREGGRWTIHEGETSSPTARARVSDNNAWKLLFNGLLDRDAVKAVRVEGPPDLAAALLNARSVIV